MILECDKREAMTFPILSDALRRAAEIGRCLWAQVEERDSMLYRVFPEGRVVQYTLARPWKSGRPEVKLAV